jgi:hypothetical protein
MPLGSGLDSGFSSVKPASQRHTNGQAPPRGLVLYFSITISPAEEENLPSLFIDDGFPSVDDREKSKSICIRLGDGFLLT